jgi:DDE superfamily endonuclease
LPVRLLTARSPGLHGALLAAKAAGYSHVSIDGMLIETDRCRTPGPTPGVDLRWSGKHDNHRGNVQVVTVPDGWPIWTSPVRPGRKHDTTAIRAHTEIRAAMTGAAGTYAPSVTSATKGVRHHHRGVQETQRRLRARPHHMTFGSQILARPA